MQKRLLYVSLIIMLLFMFATIGQSRSRNSTFKLTSKQLKIQKAKAYKADKVAAYKVYAYYNFCFADHPETYRWLLLAKELGHPIAKNHYQYLAKRTNRFSSEVLPRNAFDLSEPQKEKYKRKSKIDNGIASFWLYLYYRFNVRDLKLANNWLKISLGKKLPLAVQGIFVNNNLGDCQADKCKEESKFSKKSNHYLKSDSFSGLQTLQNIRLQIKFENVRVKTVLFYFANIIKKYKIKDIELILLSEINISKPTKENNSFNKKITVDLTNMPFLKALKIVCAKAGLMYVAKTNLILIGQSSIMNKKIHSEHYMKENLKNKAREKE